MTRSYVYRHQEVNLIGNEDLINLMTSVFQKGGTFRFCAGGVSMWPFIRNGDIITLIPATQRSIENGDILAYKSSHNNKLTVHRMIAKRGNQYLIKADNSTKSDGWVIEEKILGIVVRVERKNKIVNNFNFAKGLISWTSKLNLLQYSTRIARTLTTQFLKLRKSE